MSDKQLNLAVISFMLDVQTRCLGYVLRGMFAPDRRDAELNRIHRELVRVGELLAKWEAP